MNKTPVTIAGCRLDITLDIDKNLQEIKSAIDWSKENGVQLLNTPECALSGYLWKPDDISDPKIKEIDEALEEIKSIICV